MNHATVMSQVKNQLPHQFAVARVLHLVLSLSWESSVSLLCSVVLFSNGRSTKVGHTKKRGGATKHLQSSSLIQTKFSKLPLLISSTHTIVHALMKECIIEQSIQRHDTITHILALDH